MTVYNAESTQFFLAFDATKDTAGAWTKAVADSPPLERGKIWKTIEVGDWTLRQNEPDAPWWYVSNDQNVLANVPPDLVEFLTGEPAWTATQVRLYSNVMPTDEARRPRLGVYVGRGKYAGCKATVTLIDSETGRIGVSVTGTYERYSSFYGAIRAHKLKPATWHEPKPHWVKPRWIKVLIGYRGHEPEPVTEAAAA